MELWSEVQSFFSTAWEQISSESPGNSSIEQNFPNIYFTRQFYYGAEQFALTKEDGLDVYYYGEEVEIGKMIREYPEYELGITFFQDPDSGRIVITAIWKQQIIV